MILSSLEALRLPLTAPSVVLNASFLMNVATKLPVLIILVSLNRNRGSISAVTVWLWRLSRRCRWDWLTN